jgi:hypothetical protein
MGTVPTVYRWDDAGAPLRPGSNSDSAKVNYIATVLRAALVDGYGTKSAAGWEELYFTADGGGSTRMRQVLRNGPQNGVISLMRSDYDRLERTEVGTGWDGSEVLNSPGQLQYIDQYGVIEDVRSVRWCVIANDAAAVVLMWRDPAGRSGLDLSNYNGVAMTLGALMPWGSDIDSRAAPNISVYSPFELGNALQANDVNCASCAALVEPDGGINVSQGQTTYRAIFGGHINSFQWDVFINAPETFLIPMVFSFDGTVFAHVPGVYSAFSRINSQHLVDLRDVQGLWTGDLTTFRGAPAIIVAHESRYGVVSLNEDEWP